MKDVSLELGRRRFWLPCRRALRVLTVRPAVLGAEDTADKDKSPAHRLCPLDVDVHLQDSRKPRLKADVYRPDDDVRRPVLLWIHGGALIRG